MLTKYFFNEPFKHELSAGCFYINKRKRGIWDN